MISNFSKAEEKMLTPHLRLLDLLALRNLIQSVTLVSQQCVCMLCKAQKRTSRV